MAENANFTSPVSLVAASQEVLKHWSSCVCFVAHVQSQCVSLCVVSVSPGVNPQLISGLCNMSAAVLVLLCCCVGLVGLHPPQQASITVRGLISQQSLSSAEWRHVIGSWQHHCYSAVSLILLIFIHFNINCSLYSLCLLSLLWVLGIRQERHSSKD